MPYINFLARIEREPKLNCRMHTPQSCSGNSKDLFLGLIRTQCRKLSERPANQHSAPGHAELLRICSCYVSHAEPPWAQLSGGEGTGCFTKVFVDIARPVKANNTELFSLGKGPQLAGIASATEADDSEFCDRKITGVLVSEMRAKRRCTGFDGELIECGEAVYKVVKRVWKDHAGEHVCVVVHGIADVFRSKEVDGAGDADFV
ncbi:hypothetical protein L210DRAFT_480369 [Boletus edulis BED1]|uniref:Uncharacterized protein n=1 Tax=Boletus edulis BED1 TaxID=1328754 RepID=A0AAD4BEX5_BOLED|nr:hypothetical protein L210DRAFT_2290053 [Boletus edulis BED1]KAF8423441.1 hypothetical protein L210DRAFT_480369 [Boletus edulis BED1]